MTAPAPAPRRWRRIRRKVLVTVGVLVGIPTLLLAGLVIWDGGANLDPRRELMPGVAIDLRTVATDRGPVEYDLYGAEGPVVLSVHAGLGGADQARLFASWLQDDGFRILSPSRPGYLGTPLSSGRTLDQQADLLAALLDELRIERVGIFAASAGSPVAYTFAARHPDRVWGLVSVGGASLPNPSASPGSPLRTTFLNAVGQKLAKLTAMASLETIVASTLDETSTFTDDQKAQRVAYIMNTKAARTFFEASFNTTFPYEKRMPGTANDTQQTRTMAIAFDRITAPTLVIHGTQDGDVPFEHGENAAAKIPGAQHRWMRNEEHLGFWLSPNSANAQRDARAFFHEHAPR